MAKIGLTVNPRKLEHTPKGILKGIPALSILKPCSNFLEFTVGGFGAEGSEISMFRAPSRNKQNNCLSPLGFRDLGVSLGFGV